MFVLPSRRETNSTSRMRKGNRAYHANACLCPQNSHRCCNVDARYTTWPSRHCCDCQPIVTPQTADKVYKSLRLEEGSNPKKLLGLHPRTRCKGTTTAATPLFLFFRVGQKRSLYRTLHSTAVPCILPKHIHIHFGHIFGEKETRPKTRTKTTTTRHMNLLLGGEMWSIRQGYTRYPICAPRLSLSPEREQIPSTTQFFTCGDIFVEVLRSSQPGRCEYTDNIT